MKYRSMEEFQQNPEELLDAARDEVQIVQDENGVVFTVGLDNSVPPPPDLEAEGPTVDYPSVTTPQGGAIKPEGYFASN